MSSTVQNAPKPSPCWNYPVFVKATKISLFIPVVGIITQIFLNREVDNMCPAKDDATANEGLKDALNDLKKTNKRSLIRNAVTLGGLALAGVISAVALGVIGVGALVIGASAITAAVVLIDSAFRIKAIKEYGDRANALAK